MTLVIARTGRLVIRNWREEDRPLFHEINSDPEVMTFFPQRRTRTESDAFMDLLRERIETTGYGFCAVEHAETEETLGFCGLNPAMLAPLYPDDMIEIGWRLARRHWGKGYVTEAARACLRLGFEERGLAEIVAYAVPENRRSTDVMIRIGMREDPSRAFDHPRVPETHPALKRHVVYAITRDAWRAGNA